MEIKMALDALSEASAVAQGGVLAQSRGELGKFSEVFCIQPHPVCMGGEETKECKVRFCNFQVKCLLPLLTDVIIGLVVLHGLLLWEPWDVQPDGEFRDISILIRLWHHILLVDVLVGDVQYLADICGDAGLVNAVADK